MLVQRTIRMPVSGDRHACSSTPGHQSSGTTPRRRHAEPNTSLAVNRAQAGRRLLPFRNWTRQVGRDGRPSQAVIVPGDSGDSKGGNMMASNGEGLLEERSASGLKRRGAVLRTAQLGGSHPGRRTGVDRDDRTPRRSGDGGDPPRPRPNIPQGQTWWWARPAEPSVFR